MYGLIPHIFYRSNAFYFKSYKKQILLVNFKFIDFESIRKEFKWQNQNATAKRQNNKQIKPKQKLLSP